MPRNSKLRMPGRLRVSRTGTEFRGRDFWFPFCIYEIRRWHFRKRAAPRHSDNDRTETRALFRSTDRSRRSKRTSSCSFLMSWATYGSAHGNTSRAKAPRETCGSAPTETTWQRIRLKATMRSPQIELMSGCEKNRQTSDARHKFWPTRLPSKCVEPGVVRVSRLLVR
jgi:hypothetical protein